MADTHRAAQLLRSVGREMLHRSPEPDEPILRRRIRRGGLAIVVLFSLLLLLWRIAVPYPWPDEAATVAAVERSWPGLWNLLGGQDAPLVPFYVVAKLAHTVLPWVNTLVAVRTMSALAAAATAACLYSFVVRRQDVLTALITSGLLLSMPGFIRWGQDARPYALLMLTTVGSWLAWSTYRRPENPHLGQLRSWGDVIRRGWGYIVILGGSGMMSLFALFQWPAQLAADLTRTGQRPSERLRRALPSAMAMVIAAVAFSVPLWIAVTRGHGPNRSRPLELSEAQQVLDAVVMVSGQPWWLLTLALIGIVIAVLPVRLHPLLREYSPLARIATAWATIPFAFMMMVGLVLPNLVRARYLVPLLAPIAVLAGVAILLLARLAAHWVVSRRPAEASQRALGRAVAVAVVVIALMVQGVSVYASQKHIHSARGHNRKLGAVLKTLNAAVDADPSTMIVITNRIGLALVHAAQPSLGTQDPLRHISDTSSEVWPTVNTAEQTVELVGQTKVILWARYEPRDAHATRPTKAPQALARLGFVVTSSEKRNGFWVSRLERP